MEHLVAIASYVQTHVAAVIAAIVASILVGFVWHGMLFTKAWARHSGLDHLSDAEKKGSMAPGLAANVAMAFVQAAVLGRAFQILLLTDISYAIIIAVIIWLPFTAMVLLNTYTWSRKPWQLLCLDAGYNLASLSAIAAVLYVMR